MKTRTGNLFQRKPGGAWYVKVYVDHKAIIKSLGTNNRREAERRKADFMAPYLAGDAIDTLKAVQAKLSDRETELAKWEDEQHPPPTLAQIWRAYESAPQAPDSGYETAKRYRAQWQRFLRWLQANHPDAGHLHEITQAIVDKYATDLRSAGFAPGTHNQHLNTLARIWSVLADQCRLTTNPWKPITRLKASKVASRRQALTAGQLDAVLSAAAATPDIQDLLELLTFTGLREGDAVLMKWSAVDFKQRIITLVPKKTERRNGAHIYVPMMPQVLDVLNRRQSGQVLNPKAYVFPTLAAVYERAPSVLSKQIRGVFESAGLETSEKRQGRRRAVVRYGCHSLRHTFITVAAAAGLPDALIRSITGHSSDRMAQHYQQFSAAIVSDAATRIQGNGTPQALPEPYDAAQRQLDALRGHILALAEQLTVDNIEEIRTQLNQAAV
jgi:integrase